MGIRYFFLKYIFVVFQCLTLTYKDKKKAKNNYYFGYVKERRGVNTDDIFVLWYWVTYFVGQCKSNLDSFLRWGRISYRKRRHYSYYNNIVEGWWVSPLLNTHRVWLTKVNTAHLLHCATCNISHIKKYPISTRISVLRHTH